VQMAILFFGKGLAPEGSRRRICAHTAHSPGPMGRAWGHSAACQILAVCADWPAAAYHGRLRVDSLLSERVGDVPIVVTDRYPAFPAPELQDALLALDVWRGCCSQKRRAGGGGLVGALPGTTPRSLGTSGVHVGTLHRPACASCINYFGESCADYTLTTGRSGVGPEMAARRSSAPFPFPASQLPSRAAGARPSNSDGF
jgi:hypothetical protein